MGLPLSCGDHIYDLGSAFSGMSQNTHIGYRGHAECWATRAPDTAEAKGLMRWEHAVMDEHPQTENDQRRHAKEFYDQ